MKSKRSKLILIFILIAGLVTARFLRQISYFTSSSLNKELYVVKVIDGDTIELSTGEKVRYIGIDTPELRKRGESGWVYSPAPYAEEAKDFNRKLVEGRIVRLEFDVQKRDRYNRLLAYVYIGDEMVNLEMVSQGYAMIYTYPPNVKYVEEFLSAQKHAREDKKGLWIDLEKDIIASSEAGENIGFIRMVETQVLNTYLSERVLILNCRDKFKVAIFQNNLAYFPKVVMRSPDTYFRHKTIRVYGLIKDYKGTPEIIVNDSSQLQISE
ncbi:MAG: thermonuclease family protein [Candidatus Omnitrophica bacterium]|nr:thermonuclease family protein [Candidatus Omnitrophota bacterium]